MGQQQEQARLAGRPRPAEAGEEHVVAPEDEDNMPMSAAARSLGSAVLRTALRLGRQGHAERAMAALRGSNLSDRGRDVLIEEVLEPAAVDWECRCSAVLSESGKNRQAYHSFRPLGGHKLEPGGPGRLGR